MQDDPLKIRLAGKHRGGQRIVQAKVVHRHHAREHQDRTPVAEQRRQREGREKDHVPVDLPGMVAQEPDQHRHRHRQPGRCRQPHRKPAGRPAAFPFAQGRREEDGPCLGSTAKAAHPADRPENHRKDDQKDHRPKRDPCAQVRNACDHVLFSPSSAQSPAARVATRESGIRQAGPCRRIARHHGQKPARPHIYDGQAHCRDTRQRIHLPRRQQDPDHILISRRETAQGKHRQPEHRHHEC
ncbi:MAG: hypothetical protein V9E89_19140 [Ilumatobacteraceae bacterium]